jgi:putative oxidoreductase
MNFVQLAEQGLQQPELASLVLKAAMGTFFACSGWNKLANKGRHESLVKTLQADHVPAVGFTQWWVPAWELGAGAMLALNAIPAFAASVLLIICIVACFSEARARVNAYRPINPVDRVADYLYLPEVLYSVCLVAIILL